MDSLRTPKWVFLVNTAPVAVFMALCAGEFAVVHTLLPAASVGQWQLFGAVMGLLGVGGAGYAALQLVRRQPLGMWYSVVVLLGYSLFLCLLTMQSDELLPRSVPRWMVPTDPILMAWTFLMPTLAHGLLALVARFTPEGQRHEAGGNFGLAVLIPIGWALVFQVLDWVGRFWKWPNFATATFVAVMVLSTLSFFFFLVRALFIINRRKERHWTDGSVVWKVIVTIMLPLVGLGVNNGLFFGQGFREQDGIFGNFSSPWFYVLALVNGALLCVPDSSQPKLRLLQMLGRAALFGYTFYFFLVFLPFLPMAIPAIILIGVGFLLLAPLLLFVVHVRQLHDDVADLRLAYSKPLVTAVLVAGLAVLPLLITGGFWHRRQVLHEALAYVYTPNYTQTNPVNAAALSSTLAVVRRNKDRGWGFLYGSQQPYLSSYFNWLVLDNLMLSESKINELERIFSGPLPGYRTSPRWSNDAPAPDASAPQLRNATASSTYDARQRAWVSWVSLEIANANPAFQDRKSVV